MSFIAVITIAVLALSGLWHPPFGTLEQTLAKTAATTRQAATQPSQPLVLPVRTGEAPLEFTSGESVLALDRASGTVLFAANDHKRRPLASITKLMTALVILDGHNPDETMTIPKLPEYDVEAETIGLRAGERYTIKDLLAASLIPSANDAADALAISDSGSTTKFAARMNAKLRQWGISDAQFSNPSGLSDEGNYVTAASLGQIARLALEQPEIMRLVGQQTGQITSVTGRTTPYRTTNTLLNDGDFYGIKTGFTGAAGQCFVGLTRVHDHEVITIVLGSDDRFGDTRLLRSWIEANWTWL